MDRQIIYPGSIPLDTDLLYAQRDAMVALGYLAQATLGSSVIVDGLLCEPSAPATLSISVGPGCITSLGVVDALPFGSLGTDTTDPLLKIGINITSTSFTLTAPSTSGQSINYLIQASLSESDGNPIVLPYYNAANPAQPFSGSSNSGTAQNTQRYQRVQFQLKPSSPANAGSQSTPPVDSGWTGLYVVTVNYGQTQITAANISVLPGAPFIPYKLGTLRPGFASLVTFTSSGSFSIPNGVSLVKVRLCGGGGGGGSGSPSLGGAGGGAGGYTEGIVPVQAGEVIQITVGGPGSGAIAGGAFAGGGGNSSFGTILSATGGNGGASAASFAFGGAPGMGAGGTINIGGGYGSDGNGGSFVFAGNGGASIFGGGGRAAAVSSAPQQVPLVFGAGGGGCYGVDGNGGNGAGGIVIVEY